MIFLSVGTQLPFDRMVRCVDEWAVRHPQVEVFGQIGPASYLPKNFKSVDFLPPKDVDRFFQNAELIVAHAGMGTILSSLVLRKPLIVLPRRQALGEHRSDHQMTTARWLRDELNLNTAFDTDELTVLLEQRLSLLPGREIGESAQMQLLDGLRTFVDQDRHRASTLSGVIDWAGGLRKLLRESSVRAKRPG